MALSTAMPYRVHYEQHDENRHHCRGEEHEPIGPKSLLDHWIFLVNRLTD
jgi:hypothetical protein